MKILLPYKRINNTSIDDDKVMGGIERFAQLIHKNISNVIPVGFTEQDQKKRLVTDKVVHAAKYHQVDLIISNYDNATLNIRLQDKLDIPILWICHNLSTSISKVQIVQNIPKFIKNGGTLIMVSKYQHHTWTKLSKRINGDDVHLDVSGYISPSFCSATEPRYNKEDLIHDAITVGRCDKNKDPFLLNKKVLDLHIKSTVITSIYKSEKNSQYYEKNLEWEKKYPDKFKTLWHLPHKEVLDNIAKSKVLVSTLPGESFGITALESLSCGVPVILLCDSNLTHASEEIAADNSHFIKLKKTCSQFEFFEAYETLAEYSEEKRKEIYDLTQEKHSLSSWKTRLEKYSDLAIERYNARAVTHHTSNLDKFLVDRNTKHDDNKV